MRIVTCGVGDNLDRGHIERTVAELIADGRRDIRTKLTGTMGICPSRHHAGRWLIECDAPGYSGLVGIVAEDDASCVEL
jgi:hypothetical protein